MALLFWFKRESQHNGITIIFQMCIRDRDHCVVCKVMQVAAFLCCFVQDELSGIGYHEILLEDTELSLIHI